MLNPIHASCHNRTSDNSPTLSSCDYHNNTTTHLSSYSNDFSSQDQFMLESTPYRKRYGMKEEIDEHSFFSESSGTIKRDCWELETLAINNSLAHSKQTTFSDYHQNRFLSYQQHQKQDEQHQQQKVMHHFSDEWLPNNEDKDSCSRTQLSIPSPLLLMTSSSHINDN